MKRILLLFLGIIAQGAFAQTTVTYNHRTNYYTAGFGDGGSVYDVAGNTTEIGMWANYAAKQSAVWRPLKTAGDNTGQARTMAVGDEFSITIAATRAYGQIGVALLANPSTSGWADRTSNYVAQVNLDGLGNGAWGTWYARYKDGATQATSISGSTSYVDYTIRFKLQSTNRMTISVSNGSTTNYIRDVEINGTALPTHYSVYLADDWNGSSGADIFVKPGYVKSTGVLELGYFLGSGSLAFTGVNNGIKANSVSDTEVNTVYAGGNTGTSVIFSGANTFTGSLTVNAGATLSLTNSLAIGNVGNVTVNGTLKVEAASLSLLTAGNALTLGANSLLTIGENNSFISAFATHSVNSSSTVDYNGSAQQIALLSGTQQYGTLTASGSGQKTLQGSLKAGNLTVNSGTSVKAAVGQTLTVANALTNNGQILVENNGALVQQTGSTYSGTGTATVHRNSNALKRLDYTLWSSPVTGQNLLNFSPLTWSASPSRFYTYGILPNGSEGYLSVDPAATSFAPATGYLIRTPNVLSPNDPEYNLGNATYVHEGAFTGTPNNGTINVTGLFDHYMAVGNPYASPISVQQFLSQNSGVISGTIYLWRKRNVLGGSSSSYVQINNSGYVENTAEGGDIDGGIDTFYADGDEGNWILSPGQGFIVGVQNAGNITFTNSMRVAAPATGSQPFFKTKDTNDEPITSKWWLNLTGANNLFSQALVAYMPEATLGMDYGYDGALFSDVATQLYSKEADTDFSIQARPQFAATDVVKLGFSVPAAGQYTLSLDHVSGVFAQGQDIYIKDNQMGTTTLLGEEGYTFTSDWGTVNDRFEVVYQTEGALGNTQLELENAVLVYQSEGVINISTCTIEMTGVTVYDTLGRRLYAQSGIDATQTSINSLNATQQVLIIEVATARGKVTKKIIY